MWFIHHLCVLLLISSAGSFRAYGNDRVEELVAASRISEPGTMNDESQSDSTGLGRMLSLSSGKDAAQTQVCSSFQNTYSSTDGIQTSMFGA